MSFDSVNGINESDPNAMKDLAIWFFFQISADNICLPVLVATFFFAKSVKRNPTLVNMCITWIVAGVSSSLLLYAGKDSGPEPGHALCVVQTSLLYGTPPMCSTSALALIYTVWDSLNFKKKALKNGSSLQTYVLIAAPYIALSGFAIATAIVSTHDLRKVNRTRRFFYCSVDNPHLSDTMSIFTAMMCLFGILLEIHTAIRIVRGWRVFCALTDGKHGFDKQLVVRLFIFSVYVAIAMAVATIMNPKSPVPDLFAASIGMALFVVFGIRSDVLRAWAFWLPAREPPPPPLPPKDRFIFSTSADEAYLQPRTPVQNTQEISTKSETAIPKSVQTIYDTASLRSSLSSKKADNVIIIGKPGEAFGSYEEGVLSES